MRQLMISLDKKILDKNSAVARRMVEYGEKDELFIIIPNSERIQFDLSPTVHVLTSWGKSKPRQYWELYGVGERLLKKEKIEQITAQDPFFMGLTAVWFKQQFKLPIEIQLHGDFFSSNYYRFQSGPMNHLRWHIGKYVVRHADRVRVVGERIRQSLVKLGINPQKIIIRPVPTDFDFIKNYQPKSDLFLLKLYPEFKKIFLFLGRLDPIKNLEWLIELFSSVTQQKADYGLVIVGNGSEQKKLDEKVKSLGLGKNIKFEPWVFDPFSYLKTAHCVLFPSLSEGYGLVAMEAAAAGCPVIMNDVGVANYELKPSDKVKILAVNDREKWIQAILSV